MKSSMSDIAPFRFAITCSAFSSSTALRVFAMPARWMSPGDMSFMAAATNAVCAANVVDAQLATVAVELEGSVDKVRAAIDDATAIARQDSHVDVGQVSLKVHVVESLWQV